VHCIKHFTASMALAIWMAGCTANTVTLNDNEQAIALASLKSGSTRLMCQTPACAGVFGYNLQLLRARASSADWIGLAAQVQKINYRSDLGYYYLGLAAEELGVPAAALPYYQASVEISRAGLGCAGPIGDLCNGIILPQAAMTGFNRASAAVQASRQVTSPPLVSQPVTSPPLVSQPQAVPLPPAASMAPAHQAPQQTASPAQPAPDTAPPVAAQPASPKANPAEKPAPPLSDFKIDL
jgi:hypothetical protein